MDHKTKLLAGAMGLTVALCGARVAPASAVENAESPAVSAINEVAPEVLQRVADEQAASPAADSVFTAHTDASDVTVTIPVDPNSDIVIDGDETVGIGLPNGDAASEATLEEPGVVSYDNGDDSTTVPVVKEDGSVQIVTVIESADAPTTYAYPLDIPAGATVTLNDATGGVIVAAADGSFVAGIAPAWAKDAAGIDVPTKYEVTGTTLTQIVEHGEGTNYPVVADPWMGQNLYYTPVVYNNAKGKIISVKPTPLGGTMATTVNLYMWWAHADEVKNKLGANKGLWNNNIQEQFFCHIAGYPVSARPTYDMETWRVYLHWDVLIPFKCNYGG